MNDVKTVQRARGWRECEYEDENWHQPETAPCVLEVYEEGESCCRCGWDAPYPDPLADTPEGWCEFGQILKWAHENGLLPTLELSPDNRYVANVYVNSGNVLWLGDGYGEVRTAIIAALAEAVRRTNSRSEG